MNSTNGASIRIGADVGGTFTDVIAMDGRGGVWTHKLPSTPPNFEEAVLRAVEHLLGVIKVGGDTVAEVAHGTTVATNAVLEHRGARTALITTRGFRDILELRRVRAPQMYDLFWEKPKELVERHLRFEITERISASGEILKPLRQAELGKLAKKLEKEGIESVAVCFLHAYAFPAHELIVGKFLRKHLPRIQVSLSSEVLRERREYERTATTVVNAYVRPIMKRYLTALRGGLDAMKIQGPLLIMQSAGGLTPEKDAAIRPVFVLESGPAAGVLAAACMTERLGIRNAITLDIGGTTAKAAMIESGQIAYSPEYEVGASLSASNRLVGGGGDRIRAPTIDIAEVGSGGGSIASLDRAGGLHVGPRSAGAAPGPACYQRGGVEPTVTDANVVLGYIRAGKLADGAVTVDLDAARRAIHDRIAKPLGMDVLQAAEGIHRIANACTMRALRAVSTERGRDPRDFVLMAFGGSGPIHGAGLARELYIQQTIVPPLPGLFSAVGLLFSGVEHHDVRSCRLHGANLTTGKLQRLVDEMERKMTARFADEGFARDQVALVCHVDIRFLGQASEIRLPLNSNGGRLTTETVRDLQTRFEAEHERLYGHRSDPDSLVEVVAVRLVGRVAAAALTGGGEGGAPIQPAERLGDSTVQRSRRAFFGGKSGAIDTPVIARREITGALEGPLLIDEYDSTTVVPPETRVRLDNQGNIVLSRAEG